MTADAHMILAGGTVMTRDDVVASLQYAPPWDGYRIEDTSIAQVTDDVVVLLYTGTGERTIGDDFIATMATTYVRVDDDWQIAHYQQTPIS